MSLRSKIVLILSVVVVLYAAIDNTIQRLMVSRSFTELEEQEARKHLERATAGIEGTVQVLDRDCATLATWDACYDYVRSRNPLFESSFLHSRTLERIELNLLYVLDSDLKLVWGCIEDSVERAPLRMREFPSGGLTQGHRLVMGMAEDQSVAGLLNTEHGPMLVSMHPILDTEGQAPARGRLIMGRFLDEALIEEIGQRTGVRFEVWALERSGLPEREGELYEVLTTASAPVLDERDDGKLYVYTALSDVRKRPELLLKAHIDRDITAHGTRAVNYALLSTLATAFLILFVLLRLLRKIVVDPIAKLTKHAVTVGRSEDTSVKIGMRRDDEIGQLSHELDEMMEKLARSRAQLAKTARMAGMSEIATGVLHNVGNVLNSVNVSANLVGKRVSELALRDLELMYGVLEEHADDLSDFIQNDPRGVHLLPFLKELIEGLGRQRDEVTSELNNLDRSIEHIIKLVRSQQAYAGAKGVYEPTVLSEQLEEALEISRQSYGWGEDVEVVREYEEFERVPVDRNKLMEVLVNLIQNARQSMDEAGVQNKRLVLRVASAEKGRVRIEVRDNGLGIARENLARIFNHGFTTRADGHGFGLHISANAATEMKGSLSVTSEGEGRGASFILELPRQEPQLQHAA